MTFEITRPETEARIRRYLRSGQFHDLDELLTRALDALPEPAAVELVPLGHRTGQTGQDLIDACAKTQGLLTDEEVDMLFRRSPSFARPVDLE